MKNQENKNPDWFNLLCENSSEMISIHLDTGQAIFVSKSVENILDISPEEYLNKMPYDYVLEDDFPVFNNLAEKLAKPGKPLNLAYRVKNKDGNLFWVESRLVPVELHGENQLHYISFTNNIDKLKKTQEELLQYAELFNRAQKLAKIGTFSWHIPSNIVTWSDQLYRIHGYNKKSGAPSLKSYYAHVHEEDRAILKKKVEDALRGKPYSCDYRVIHEKTGETRYIHSEGTVDFDNNNNPLLLIGTDQDITERKNIELELAESESKYRTVVQNAKEMIFIIKNGIVIFVNKAILKANQATEAQIIGRSFLDFVAPEEKKNVAEIYRNRIKNRKKYLKYESKAQSLTGRIYDVEISSSLIQFEGEPAVLVIMHDITEQREAERKLIVSEQNFREIVESSPDSIVTTSMRGEIIDVNPAFLNKSGFSSSEIIGQSFFNNPGIIPADRPAYRKAFKEIVTGLKVFPNFRWKTKEGKILFGELIPAGFGILNGEKVIHIFIRDITNRLKAEKAIRDSEARYRALFENSTDPTLIIEDYTFVLCNETTVKFLGYKSKADIEGKHPWELSPPGQPDDPSSKRKAIRMMDTAIKHGSHRFEWVHTHAGGEEMWIDVALTYIPSTKQIYTVWRDITERKTTQLAIDKMEESTYASFGVDFIEKSVLGLCETLRADYVFAGQHKESEHSVETVAVCNHDKLLPNFTYSLSGTPCENVIGIGACSYLQDVDKMFPKDDLLTQMGVKSYIGIPLVNSENRRIGLLVALFCKNLEEAGFIEKILIIYAYRVTSEMERMGSLKELQRSEEKWRSLGENAPGNISLIDKDLKIIFINKTNPGYTKDMFLGQSVLNFYADNEKPRFEKILRQVFTTKKPVYFENTYTDKNGTRYFSNHAGPLYRNKKVENLILFSTDITEEKKLRNELDMHRKHLEEMVQARTAELVSANKDLESFAYSVSHDLRAPLRHINAYSAMLRDSLGDNLDKEQLRYFSTVISASNRMAKLIDDILALSRVGRQEMTKKHVNMNRLIEHVLQDNEMDMEGKKVDIKIGSLPKVQCDERLIRSVWDNLVSNALKYSGKRKVIKITIGSEEKSPGVVTYFIKDNGIGFEQEYADKIMGVFHRLPNTKDYEGTGIGLAIAQKIIDRHGGQLWAEGYPDKGACFYFSLPAK